MKRLLLSVIIVIFLFSAFSNGQVVNIESKRMRTDTVGWAGDAEANFQLSKTTETIYDAGAKLHFQFKQKDYLWLFLNEYRLIKGGDTKYVNSAFSHLRYNHKITKELLRWEAFLQLQYNGALSVGARFLAGTGPRLKFIETDLFRLYAAALYMYEYEENVNKTIFLRKHRVSSYVTFTLETTSFEVIHTTYYQPNLKSFTKDYRLSSQTDLNFKITKSLKFVTGFSYRFETEPFPDMPKTTYYLFNGLKFSF
jgi:hypothetical protein